MVHKKWKSFFNTASGLVNVNFAKKEAMTPLVAPSGENSEDGIQKREQATVQRLTLEKWTPCTGFRTRGDIIGDSVLVINGVRGL